MPDDVLWRRLTRTDFNAMNGIASPSGRGGGAMHISLGVESHDFPIREFLRAGSARNVQVEIPTRSANYDVATLWFGSNAQRRGGEWLIRDQYSNRHPAWSDAAGFPSNYDAANPPYVLVFRVGGNFHARFASARRIAMISKIPQEMVDDYKGIAVATPSLLRQFQIPNATLTEVFAEQADEGGIDPFDPSDLTDARRKVFASVLRRQGQPEFRSRLLHEYDGQCAITRTATPFVLEAAHITPYLGRRTNSLSNGLILRADVHTLFDLALISIDPSQRHVAISRSLSGSPYANLHGGPLLSPRSSSARPSEAALRKHFELFRTQY
ncbi:MAG: HNH endonuclease [Gammaproteobacteria bacterium]